MPNKKAISLILVFLIINLVVSINQTPSNLTLKNETLANQTVINETISNETLFNITLINKSISNETQVNETLANVTLNQTMNETLGKQSLINITQVNETFSNETFENITPVNETLKNITFNEKGNITLNQTVINETIPNETLKNITSFNESLINITVNETLGNITSLNQTILNETISNETLFNITLLNKTISNETQVNETFFNQTLVNETLANLTFNQTLGNESLMNITQVNKTVNKTVISVLEKNLTYGEKRLYLGSSLKDNTVMIFEGIYLEEKDTVYYVDITIFDNSSVIYSKDKKTDYNGYFDFLFVPESGKNYQMFLTVLSPSGNKSTFNFTFSIEKPIPSLYPSLIIEKPSSIYLGIPFNVTIHREGGACENYSLSATPSINNTLIGEIYGNNSIKQTYLIEDSSKIPEIFIKYQDAICKINDKITVDLRPHIVVERIVDPNAVINKTLTVRIELMVNVPIYNVTVKEMFNSSLISNVKPLLNDTNKNANVALSNNSIEWYYPMINANVTLEYTLIPLQAGRLRLGSCYVSYEVLA